MSTYSFRRPRVAAAMADGLIGVGPFDYGSGLFLAAPRRTGKSTFLREDLMPELAARGVETAYVDLWANRLQDPGILIADAIKVALRRNEKFLAKASRRLQGAKVGLGGLVSLDIGRVGSPEGSTLGDALAALILATKRPVALIVDEAQHALASEAGINAMFALKSARDLINLGEAEWGFEGRRLLLVFTGSHRDKLANLVLRRDMPFFGASVLDFPLLGRDYSDAYTIWLNERLAADNRFDPDDVFTAFDVLGRRPELLRTVLQDAAMGVQKAAGLKAGLAWDAKALRDRLWEDYDRDWSHLTTMQQVVLARLIEQGDRFIPFSAETLAAYGVTLGRPVGAPDVQSALDALRQGNIVWRSARATYTLEDQSMADWYKARQPLAAAPERQDGADA